MRLPLVALVVAASAVAAPLTAQDTTGAIPTQGIVTGATTGYVVHPGDVLDIHVWGQDAFSGKFQVDVDGMIQYPVVGDVNTRNLTIAQIRDTLRAGLSQIFTTPFVTVTPLFRIAVLGDVFRPGLYTADPTMTVVDVVAMAGGANPSGNMSKIRVLRGGKATEVRFDAGALGGRSLAEIGVRSGDEIVVPRKSFTREDLGIVLAAAQVALSVAIFIAVH